MVTLETYLDDRLVQGQYTFTKKDAMATLSLHPKTFLSAADRLKRKSRILSPKRGFYLILRPEDRVLGAPPPERWIASLMSYLRTEYRVSLLRAAAFHGSSHQAAMVFQVVAPKQLRGIVAGRQRVQFLFQAPRSFEKANHPEWLDQLKTDTGAAKIAGIELTLLDAARYFHKAGGINGAAQIVHDLGARADAHKLTEAAGAFENTSVRRLGYLLDHFQHHAQADSLSIFVKRSKSTRPLNPAARSFSTLTTRTFNDVLAAKWKLSINEQIEIDP